VQKEFTLACAFSAGNIFTIADTKGMKVNQTVILFDGSNREKASIASFVADTSFTVKKARATVTDGSVTDVEFQGFHNIKVEPDNAGTISMSAFEYEPLEISPSRSIERLNQEFKFEKVGVTHRNVAADGDIFYPVHSDGVVGNWNTSSIQLIGKSNASTFGFDQDLKNINISAGTLDIKVSSERWVPVANTRIKF